MTYKQAQKVIDKIVENRFGLLLQNGNGVWIYECKSEMEFGRKIYFTRFRGCYSHGLNEKMEKYIYRGKKWEYEDVAWHLCRTDWKGSVVSSMVLDMILSNKNLSGIK
jgi:hypothetical protein